MGSIQGGIKSEIGSVSPLAAVLDQGSGSLWMVSYHGSKFQTANSMGLLACSGVLLLLPSRSLRCKSPRFLGPIEAYLLKRGPASSFAFLYLPLERAVLRSLDLASQVICRGAPCRPRAGPRKTDATGAYSDHSFILIPLVLS